MTKNNLGNLIKKARIEKGMSQDDLAKKLFVTRQAISGWETNKNLPGISQVPNLCKYLVLDEKEVLEYFDNLNKNIKSKNKKRIIILISTIILLILSFGFILSAIIKNNDFKVYSLSIDSDDVILENGLFIKSKIKNYFQLGNISFPFLEENDYIYSLKIFKKENEDERLIYTQKGDDSIVIEEDYGYGEYFNDIDEGIENLFLEVVIVKDDNMYTFVYSLHLDLKIKSNKLFFEKGKRIIDNSIHRENNDEQTIEQCIIKEIKQLNYSLDNKDFTYKKNINNDYFTYVVEDKLYYSNIEKNKRTSLEYSFKYNYINGKLYNAKTGKYEFIYEYSLNEDKLSCDSGNCEEYKIYNEKVLKEVEKITKASAACIQRK